MKKIILKFLIEKVAKRLIVKIFFIKNLNTNTPLLI